MNETEQDFKEYNEDVSNALWRDSNDGEIKQLRQRKGESIICYRDMSFCANSDGCPVRDGCPHYFSPEEQVKAEKWWGGAGYLVAFMAMAETCKRRKEKQNGI